jgi:predicted nucleic acid-binding protein
MQPKNKKNEPISAKAAPLKSEEQAAKKVPTSPSTEKAVLTKGNGRRKRARKAEIVAQETTDFDLIIACHLKELEDAVSNNIKVLMNYI